MVGAFRDVIPGTHQRLELREGRVHLFRHGSLLGFLPDDRAMMLGASTIVAAATPTIAPRAFWRNLRRSLIGRPHPATN
jgi:hypothetical protein